MKNRLHATMLAAIVLIMCFGGTADAFGHDLFPSTPAVQKLAPVIEVAPGEDVQLALDANPGATIRLLAGRHELSDTLLVNAGQVIEGEGGKAKSGSLVTTLASSATVAIFTQTAEPVVLRDLNIEAQAQGLVHSGAGDLTIDNCRVVSALDPALPEAADGRAITVINVFPSFSPPAPGGIISITESDVVAGSDEAGSGDRDAIGIFGFFNQAAWQRIEVSDSRLTTRQHEGAESAFAVGFEMLGMANADAEIVLRNNEISAYGYGIQIVGFGGAASITGNVIAADGGGIMYSSRNEAPGLIAKNKITVTGTVRNDLPDFPGVYWPTACLLLGPSPAGFIGPVLAGSGIVGLLVEKNSLDCTDSPGVMMITLSAFNTDPPVMNASSGNSFVKNDFKVSGSAFHAVLGVGTSDNTFLKNSGLDVNSVQDGGTENYFD